MDSARRIPVCSILLAVALAAQIAWPQALPAQNPANPLTSWTVTIVLPPRLMAGHPATLAVLGVDGKLAPGVKVDLGDGQTATTDRTGRAIFDVPKTGDYILAKGSGASAAALIDPAVGESEPATVALPPVVSNQDRFWICGSGLRGNADENSVKINGDAAPIIAASPICLVALPGPGTKPGAATVSIEAPGTELISTTNLVALEFVPPNPPLKPGQKGEFAVRVQGSSQKLGVVVRNRSPGVLKFARGDVQELVTQGGADNTASIGVQTITSGDFSLDARLLPAADAALAARYLLAAEPLAPRELQRKIGGLAKRLKQHPRETQTVRAEVQRIAASTMAGDFRTLLDAAESVL